MFVFFPSAVEAEISEIKFCPSKQLYLLKIWNNSKAEDVYQEREKIGTAMNTFHRRFVTFLFQQALLLHLYKLPRTDSKH